MKRRVEATFTTREAVEQVLGISPADKSRTRRYKDRLERAARIYRHQLPNYERNGCKPVNTTGHYLFSRLEVERWAVKVGLAVEI